MSKSGLLPIEKTVKECLQRNFSKAEELRFIVGVSGGADSVSLLYIFKRLGVNLKAVHVNYQKRGEESDKDAEFVENICRKWNLNYQIIEVDPKEAAKANFQAWTRSIRYQLFEKGVQKWDAAGIAVAHHQDDQIETILQKLFRGSGFANWSAMEVWDGKLFRPFLSVSRAEIERYCEKQSLPFRTDESNLKSNYARNFLRNEWLPEITQYFPGWRKNVLRIAPQSEIFKSALEYILQNIRADDGRLKRHELLSIALPLQKSLILFYIKKLDSSIAVSADALGELDKLSTLQTGKALQLGDNLKIVRDRSYFKIVTKEFSQPKSKTFHQEQLQQEPVYYKNFELTLKPFRNPDYDVALYLDAQKLCWPVQIRPWMKGDKIQPLGMNGRQSVADHLTNRKVSAFKKSQALVLQSFDETIYAVIFPATKNRRPPGTISEQVKCSERTSQSLTIKSVL